MTKEFSHRLALALIQPTDKPPPLPRQFLKFARQSINEWSDTATKREQLARRSQQESFRAKFQPEPVPEISIDELLKSGQFATAIEHLENALKEQSQDAELWLKLAEAHAVYCADAAQAAKVVRRMGDTSRFTPEELDSARAKLKEWKPAARRS